MSDTQIKELEEMLKELKLQLDMLNQAIKTKIKGFLPTGVSNGRNIIRK